MWKKLSVQRTESLIFFPIKGQTFRKNGKIRVCPLRNLRKPLHKRRIYLYTRGGSGTTATSKTKHFVIIVNGWKPLTIITKSSILDVAAVLGPPLYILFQPNVMELNKNSHQKYFVKELFFKVTVAITFFDKKLKRFNWPFPSLIIFQIWLFRLY